MDEVYKKYCKVFTMLDKLDQKYKDDTPIITKFKRPKKPEKSEEQKAEEMKEYKKQYYLENKQRYAERNKLYRLEKKIKNNI
jgi:hypothetical protein